MTAEIIVMNKQAVALAADSAVTYGSKVYYSANKVFSLSKYHPVGIMIYGNANLMQVPWEIIIKTYRQHLSDRQFDTLDDYALHFIKFIGETKVFFPEKSQHGYIEFCIASFLDMLNEKIKAEIEKTIETRKQIGKRDVKKIIKSIIDAEYRTWDKFAYIKDMSKKDAITFAKKYSATIKGIISSKYKADILTKDLAKKLELICAFLFLKLRFKNSITSGVVIAGYGSHEIFPSYNHIKIEAFIDDKLKYSVEGRTKISFEESAVIEPFAQSEMVGRFIRGVDSDLSDFMKNYLYNIFQNYGSAVLSQIPLAPGPDKQSLLDSLKKASLDVYKKYNDDLNAYIQKHNVDPIINMVNVLPKDELALMAEALVNLTSFKRKVSDESETVGGPIDVAVISKGDGFVWIKRKHYFNPELNHSFFDNYYRK